MFDYLNEIIFFSGLRKDGSTLRKARIMKQRGDAVIFNMLCDEWVSRFKWESAEKSICSQLIERTILLDGACAFAKYYYDIPIAEEDIYDWRNFRISSLNNLSFYAQPTACALTDYVGRFVRQTIPINIEDADGKWDCALIQDNLYGFPPLMIIFYYAERLSIINASINACIQNILGTSVITCSREQAGDVERQRRAAQIGVPYILKYDEDVRPTPAAIASTPGAAEALTVLYEAHDKTHGDFLQSIGVRVNNEMNKKSGITPMELIENRQNVDLSLNSSLDCRKQGIELCERIGLKGLTVKLDNFKSLIGNYDSNGVLIQSSETISQNAEQGVNENERQTVNPRVSV